MFLCVCTKKNETMQETLFVRMLESCAIFAWKTHKHMMNTAECRKPISRLQLASFLRSLQQLCLQVVHPLM